MEAEKKWIPIESNPETFTGFAHELGYPPFYSFMDVFSLDDEMWQFVPQPIISLIFLYEIKDEHKQTIYENQSEKEAQDAIFIK